MKPRYRIFKRGKMFYKRDTVTQERTSLQTSDRADAQALVDAENQAVADPALGQQLAKAYLSASDPLAMERTWQHAIVEYQRVGAESTRDRKERAYKMKEFDIIRKKTLVGTFAEDFYAVLRSDKVSVNTYLIQLQNFVVDMGWIPRSIIPRRRFPKATSKRKPRAVTREEHEKIIEAESNSERRLYYQTLWAIGASQTDGALLTDENFDMEHRVLMYERKKTGQLCRMAISDELRDIVRQLPKQGLLFPGIQNGGQNFRASEFRRRCRLLKLSGITLHSYRYSWAERAFEAGIPERFAMAALGHGSKAIHRTYAKAARTVCPAIPIS